MFYKLQYLCLNTRKMRYPKYLETFSYYNRKCPFPTQPAPVTILNNPKLLLALKSLRHHGPDVYGTPSQTM